MPSRLGHPRRFIAVLYLATAGVILATIGLAVWAAQAQSRLRVELDRAATSHAEVLTREFVEHFWSAADTAAFAIFSGVEMDVAHPAAVVDTILRRIDERRECRCGAAFGATSAFAWHSSRPRDLWARGIPSTQAAPLRDKIAAVVDTLPGPRSEVMVLKSDLLGNELFAVAFVRRDRAGAPAVVVGFLGDLDVLRVNFIEPIADYVTQLRLGSSGRGIVSWRVLRPTGDALFSDGINDTSLTWTTHRLWARTFLLDSKDVREKLLDPIARQTLRTLPVPGSDPRATPYLVAVQVNPDSLSAALYGTSTLRYLTLLCLLVATILLTVVTAALVNRLVAHTREREAFAAAVAHDLRTPLTQILLYAETLQLDRPAHRARKDAARVIVRETRRLIHLVENALHFTRGAVTAPRLHLTTLSPATLVEEAVANFQLMLTRSGVALETQLDDAVLIVGDSDALTQAFSNVLDNALRYGPPAQTLRIGVEQIADHVQIWVEDEGPGVAPSDRHKVFEPFARGGNSAGTGIGLAVARQLVELMDGTMRIEDGRRGGARVSIILPVQLSTRRATGSNGERPAMSR